MSFEPALMSEAREFADARMVDTFACRFRGTGATQNEGTGRELPVWETRFTTAGRLAARSGTPGTHVVDVAGVQIAQASLELHLPISAPPAHQGDVFECLTAEDDDQLVGLAYRVVGPSAKSQATARRLDVVEVDAPWV